jgi:hypothetical protein
MLRCLDLEDRVLALDNYQKNIYIVSLYVNLMMNNITIGYLFSFKIILPISILCSFTM